METLQVKQWQIVQRKLWKGLNSGRAWVDATLDLLYPPLCGFCRGSVENGKLLCASCDANAVPISGPACQICSEPFEGEIDHPFTCANCAERKFHFDYAVASYRSTGIVRECIHRFKYNHQFWLRHLLTQWLESNLQDRRLAENRPDCLVPVPLHPARKRERGFNQAQVLAELLSKKTGTPIWTGLERHRFTDSQTQFDREKRMENLRNAFQIRHTSEVRNLHLLLIDDVLTTGTTVDECARVLMQAGAASVRVAAVARG